MPVAVIAAVAILGEVAAGVAISTIVTGMLVGAVVGAVTSAISGGNILKGALTGGLMGGALAGAGELLSGVAGPPVPEGTAYTGGPSQVVNEAANTMAGTPVDTMAGGVAGNSIEYNASLGVNAQPGGEAVTSAIEPAAAPVVAPQTTGTATQAGVQTTATAAPTTANTPVTPPAEGGLMNWVNKNPGIAMVGGQAASGLATAMLSPDQEKMAQEARDAATRANVKNYAAPTQNTSGSFNMSYRPAAPYTQAPSYAKA